MAEKLKSITKQIPWSLLLKSGAVAALWLLGKAAWSVGFGLPFWLFAILAAYLYFIPPFRPGYFLPQFLLFGFFSVILPPGIMSALALGAVFSLLLGIKDLVFINRETAYELLMFLLLFLAAISGYSAVDNWAGWGMLFLPPVLGVIYALLARELPFRDPPREHRAGAVSVLGGFLIVESALVLLFLPLDFLYQAALFMLFVILLAFLEMRVKSGEVSMKGILTAFAPFAILAALVLLLNSWRI